MGWLEQVGSAGAHRLDEAKIGPGEDHEQPFCPILQINTFSDQSLQYLQAIWM